MIKIRKKPGDDVEEIDLSEFERRARAGEISPRTEVCFPVVTGSDFVEARELELFRGLYAAGPITFKRYFHLGRMPWLTLALIGGLVATYYLWQGGAPRSTEDLLRAGAKSPALMVELGQWWRLLTANFLHVSGWHLLVNSIFLLNLGGPTEAIFRRIDYLLVVVAAALGTTLVSAVANPVVSCGASGMVFGVWGAAAVFGIRHRDILPERYRRYFIGSVIPYSVIALYLGFAMPGVDNWGHLGGLIAGSSVAAFLPARLLAPKDPFTPMKILAFAVVALTLALGALLPAGAGELTPDRYYPRNGLVVPVPRSWSTLLKKREKGNEAYAFENEAGVVVGIETRREARPVDQSGMVTRFVENDLADQLEGAQVEGVRVLDPKPVRVAGVDGQRLRTELLTPKGTTRADFLLLARGHYRYVISLSAPMWLAPAYDDTFAAVIDRVDMTRPDALERAEYDAKVADSALTRSRLAVEHGRVGELDRAWMMLESARRQWPAAGEVSHAEAQLLFENDRHLGRACERVREAMDRLAWTPALLLLAIDLHRSCDEAETAERILHAAELRFPGDEMIMARRQPAPSETAP